MATYLVGIDEVGYGPKLGPLIVGAVVFEVPSRPGGTNLWSALAKTITKSPAASPKISVCDSKILHNSSRGIRRLETSVLPFTCLFPGFIPPLAGRRLSIKQFLNRWLVVSKTNLNVGESISGLPWYETSARLNIPLVADITEVNKKGDMLRKECLNKSIRLTDLYLRLIDADGFNRSITPARNKADLLWSLTADLLAQIKKQYLEVATESREGKAGNNLRIFIGKQGGRTYYQPLLKKALTNYRVHSQREKPDKSVYHLSDGGNVKCRISFMKDGEAKHFTIALASMFAKYARELCMHAFNCFWQGYDPHLKPTAGYTVDADRFLGDIAPLCHKIGLLPEVFTRARS